VGEGPRGYGVYFLFVTGSGKKKLKGNQGKKADRQGRVKRNFLTNAKILLRRGTLKEKTTDKKTAKGGMHLIN